MQIETLEECKFIVSCLTVASQKESIELLNKIHNFIDKLIQDRDSKIEELNSKELNNLLSKSSDFING